MADVDVAQPTLRGEPAGAASLDAGHRSGAAIDAADRNAATPSPDVVGHGRDTDAGRRRAKDGSSGRGSNGGPGSNRSVSAGTAAGKQAAAPAARKPAAKAPATGGMVGCAPSWADKTWHPMAVTVASGQIRNGGTGVFIPGGLRPAGSSSAPAAASSGISSSSMSSSGMSAAGSGGPESPQGSPVAPGSPAGGLEQKQATPSGPVPLPRPASAPTPQPQVLPPGAAFPPHVPAGGFASNGGHTLGTGAFIPPVGGRAAYAAARRSLDVRPTQPPLGPMVGPLVRRTSDSHLISGPGGSNPGGNGHAASAANAAAAAAAAVDAAAQALAAAQAAAAAAGSGGVSPADSITMQLAMLQLQQQQAQLQQLQQQADLQQQLQAMQRDSLLAQFRGDAAGLLSANITASAPCNIPSDLTAGGGFLSADNLWATGSGFLSHASLADSAALGPQPSLALSNAGGFGDLLSPSSSVQQPLSAAPSLLGCGPVDAPALAQSPISLGNGLASTFGTAPCAAGMSTASNISGGGGGMASGPLLSGLTAGLGTIDEAQAGVGTFNLRGGAVAPFTGQW